MKRVLGRVAFALAAVFAVAASAHGDEIVELGRDAPAMFNPGSTGFAVIDVDGDGRDDLVFADGAANPVLAVYGRRADGSLGLKQVLPMPWQHMIQRVLPWRTGGASHVVAIEDSGQVHDFSGWPLAEQRAFPIYLYGWPPPHAVIGDIDADGVDDLVVPINNALFTYAMSDGHAERTLELPFETDARDLALAALDADPALEIVVGGSMYGPGVVVDGATGAIDFEYDASYGFGNAVATGRFDGTGATGFVTDGGGLADVFGADPYALLWDANAGGNVMSMATADIDGSGRDAIIVGNDQWGAVHVFDAVTHAERYSIEHDGFGVLAVKGVDFDGDGAMEIAFGSGRSFPGTTGLTIADAATGVVEQTYVPANGPMTIAAIGDVDGDGHEELVAVSQPDYSVSTIAVYDLSTGAEKWRSPAPIGYIDDPFYIAPAAIRLVPHAGRPGMDIVAAGSAGYDGRIEVYDGTTMDEVLGVYEYAGGPLQWREVQDVAVHDCNGDGVGDYVVIVTVNDGSARGIQLFAFSGVDGSVLWSSEVYAAGTFAERILLVPSANGGTELVAVSNRILRGFDPATGASRWWFAAENDGAIYVPDGVGGPELAVFSRDGGIAFYSATTHAYARGFSLPAATCDAVALDDDVRSLAVTTGDALVLFDGKAGVARATAASLGQCLPGATRMSANASGVVALGTGSAVFREKVDFARDRIFAGSFDPR
ncbi:MAG TPA: PQQ-binding-like beta-propeller repeat protein [Rhodanobacteraceae bacterium]|nr:PQQ-binding-like beta-propeller repeat protein [Rhodanobacteraceae bacterium]